MEFESWTSYHQFEREILRSRRYLRSATSEAFLDAVRATAKDRVVALDQNALIWRAVDALDQVPGERGMPRLAPCLTDRIMPLADKAHEGRVNPKGIPCLYAASEPWTAVAEIRPTLGAKITLAALAPTRGLTLVHCGFNEQAPVYPAEPDADSRAAAVWAYISTAFSNPVARAEDHADYAPTQVLAEVFKEMGLNGIAYRSAFSADGYNIALFQPKHAEVTGRWVYKVAGIQHRVEVASNAERWVSERFNIDHHLRGFPPKQDLR